MADLWQIPEGYEVVGTAEATAVSDIPAGYEEVTGDEYIAISQGVQASPELKQAMAVRRATARANQPQSKEWWEQKRTEAVLADADPLAKAPSLISEPYRAVASAGTSIASTVARPFSKGAADYLAKTRQDIGQVSEAARKDDWSPWLSRMYGGAVESITQAGLAAPLGAPGVIGSFALTEGNQALYDAEQAGLTGNDRIKYAVVQGGIEGAIAGAFQLVGLGGFEKYIPGLAKGAMQTSGKQFLRATAEEIPEELMTEIGHAIAEQVYGIDPRAADPTSPDFWKRMGDTVAQTLLTMGLAHGAARLTQNRQELQKLEGIRSTEAWQLKRRAAEMGITGSRSEIKKQVESRVSELQQQSQQLEQDVQPTQQEPTNAQVPPQETEVRQEQPAPTETEASREEVRPDVTTRRSVEVVEMNGGRIVEWDGQLFTREEAIRLGIVSDADAATPFKTYEEFRDEYQRLYRETAKYEPDQVGRVRFGQQLSYLAGQYPEWADRAASEDMPQATSAAEAAPTREQLISDLARAEAAIDSRISEPAKTGADSGTDFGTAAEPLSPRKKAQKGRTPEPQMEPPADEAEAAAQVDALRAENRRKRRGRKGEAVPTTFTTSKGSTYEFSEGRTVRNKSPHEGFEHKGDEGLKERSGLTVFVDPEFAREVGMWNTMQGPGASTRRIAVRGDKLVLTSTNPKVGKRGKDGEATFTTTPELGKHPIELWDEEEGGFWSKNHPGNPITSIGSHPAASQQPPQAAPEAQAGPEAVPQTETPKRPKKRSVRKEQPAEAGEDRGAVKPAVKVGKRGQYALQGLEDEAERAEAREAEDRRWRPYVEDLVFSDIGVTEDAAQELMRNFSSKVKQAFAENTDETSIVIADLIARDLPIVRSGKRGSEKSRRDTAVEMIEPAVLKIMEEVAPTMQEAGGWKVGQNVETRYPQTFGKITGFEMYDGMLQARVVPADGTDSTTYELSDILGEATEAEIREAAGEAEPDKPAEPDETDILLNLRALNNKSNRKAYKPLEDDELAVLIERGLVEKKKGNKITPQGWAFMRDADQKERADAAREVAETEAEYRKTLEKARQAAAEEKAKPKQEDWSVSREDVEKAYAEWNNGRDNFENWTYDSNRTVKVLDQPDHIEGDVVGKTFLAPMRSANTGTHLLWIGGKLYSFPGYNVTAMNQSLSDVDMETTVTTRKIGEQTVVKHVVHYRDEKGQDRGEAFNSLAKAKERAKELGKSASVRTESGQIEDRAVEATDAPRVVSFKDGRFVLAKDITPRQAAAALEGVREKYGAYRTGPEIEAMKDKLSGEAVKSERAGEPEELKEKRELYRKATSAQIEAEGERGRKQSEATKTLERRAKEIARERGIPEGRARGSLSTAKQYQPGIAQAKADARKDPLVVEADRQLKLAKEAYDAAAKHVRELEADLNKATSGERIPEGSVFISKSKGPSVAIRVGEYDEKTGTYDYESGTLVSSGEFYGHSYGGTGERGITGATIRSNYGTIADSRVMRAIGMQAVEAIEQAQEARHQRERDEAKAKEDNKIREHYQTEYPKPTVAQIMPINGGFMNGIYEGKDVITDGKFAIIKEDAPKAMQKRLEVDKVKASGRYADARPEIGRAIPMKGKPKQELQLAGYGAGYGPEETADHAFLTDGETVWMVPADDYVYLSSEGITFHAPEKAESKKEPVILAKDGRRVGGIMPLADDETQSLDSLKKAVGDKFKMAEKPAAKSKGRKKTKLQQSAAEQAQREAEEGRPDVEAMGFMGGGRFKGERVRPDEIPDAMKAPQAQEDRLEAAHGYQTPSMLQRVRETLGHLKGVFRPQEHIPQTAEFAADNEFFRLLKVAPHKAQDEAIRTTAAIVDPLGPKQLKLFERLAVMENLSVSVAQGQPLRFGFQSQEDVDAYRDRLRDIASRVPEVQKAIDTRKKIVRETVDQLIEYDLLPEAARDNAETYYHQQVHFYMLAHNLKSGGRRPGKKKRSFQKSRVLGEDLSGDEMDYNTSYIEAESSWLTDALMEIEKERLFRDLMARRDSKQSLKDRAKRQNFENVGEEELEPYNKQIAKMAAWFRKEHGLDWQDPRDEFIDEDSQFWARVKEEANKGDVPALSLFKALREREEFIRETLGDQYATWETLADQDDSVDIFQPEPGNVFYRAFTLPERIVEQLQANVVETAELSKEDLRTVLALGGPKAQYVVPTELANQLRASQKVESPHGLAAFADGAMRLWKAWATILSPKSTFKHQLRNLSGDLEPVIAADPSLLRHQPKAIKELWEHHNGRLQMSPELRAARDGGVIGSGFTAQEVPEISELPIFQRFMGKKPFRPLKGYADTVRNLSSFREDVLRYTAFLGYRHQLRQGRVKNYGGSNKAVVDALRREMGVDVAAAHLARNLIGDYGNRTVAGDWLRRRLYPFWSFQEINLQRVPRLVVNAWESGGTMRTAGVLSASAGRAILMSRIAWMYGALWVWNNLIQGGDEEDELTGDDRASPHIIFGRNPDGSIRMLRRVGALGDFLEWFGINEAISMLPKYKAGQVDAGDILWEMAFATPEKLMNSLRPDMKALYEVPTGTSLYPEPFHPRAVDRGEAASSTVGLQDEYKWMKGWALKDGSTARPHYWQRWGVDVTDPRHTALSEAYDLRNTFLKKKGKEQEGTFPVSRYKSARDAAKSEDYGAFVDWKRKFVAERGDKAKEDFQKWLGTLDPIASRLNDEDELEFEKKFLTSEQRDRFQAARNYSGELRDTLVSWWDADEQSGDMKQAVVFSAIKRMDVSEPVRKDYESDDAFRKAKTAFTVGNERSLREIKSITSSEEEAAQMLKAYYFQRDKQGKRRMTPDEDKSYNAKLAKLREIYRE